MPQGRIADRRKGAPVVGNLLFHRFEALRRETVAVAVQLDVKATDQQLPGFLNAHKGTETLPLDLRRINAKHGTEPPEQRLPRLGIAKVLRELTQPAPRRGALAGIG